MNYAYKYPVYTTGLNVLGNTHVLEDARVNSVRREWENELPVMKR
jgi:hypothetical protein